MRWISKSSPLYIWRGDIWFNEIDKEEYTPDVLNKVWKGVKDIPFPPKAKVLNEATTKL